MNYGPVDASPTKDFFVHMLTRDISLTDAILDLLDNCVDGVLRGLAPSAMKSNHPYSGYWADITLDGKQFEIWDNCGGIPWKYHDYAFRMGKPQIKRDSKLPTVGTYGIGMKRAIFKLGSHALIQSQHQDEIYNVEFSPDWIASDSWTLEAVEGEKWSDEDGTSITVSQLHENIANELATEVFVDELKKKIESHYALIIHKGFDIYVNGARVEPKPLSFYFSGTKKSAVSPYVFSSTVDGVDVFVTVGLREPVRSEERIMDDTDYSRFSRDLAGWTVICNDRVILYCNKDEQTGWGEAQVPKYHNQFISISGIVEFVSKDASKLPTTTTKRGIDLSSQLYAQVKNRMREGLKLFTDYTNDWKSREDEARRQLQSTPKKTFEEIKRATSSLKMISVKTGLKGKQFKPSLPTPPNADETVRIRFSKSREEFERVSDYLFSDPDTPPSAVGERCFDEVLRKL